MSACRGALEALTPAEVLALSQVTLPIFTILSPSSQLYSTALCEHQAFLAMTFEACPTNTACQTAYWKTVKLADDVGHNMVVTRHFCIKNLFKKSHFYYCAFLRNQKRL